MDRQSSLEYSVFQNLEYRMTQPALRPQDVVVLAKLLSYKGRRPSMAQIGLDLSLSASQVHAALNRLVGSRLVVNDGETDRPLLHAVEEFLVHGVKYAFPAQRGEVTRGVPTSWGAPPLTRVVLNPSDLRPVWPFPDGQHRGPGFQPLYRGAPEAALRDPFLYELLVLIDAIRDGRARERALAEKYLLKRLRDATRDRP